jgi:hypothetical protein
MRIVRVVLAAGWIGPLLFMVVAFVDGATRPDYDPWGDYISHLSLTDRGPIERLNLVVCGASALAFAVVAGRGRTAARWLSLAIFGGALVAAGVLVGDPGRGYPPGTPIEVQHTLPGILHDLVGLVAFLALATAAFSWSRYFARTSQGRRWAAFSRLAGAVVVFVAVFVATLTFAQGGNAGSAPVGALQRVAIVAGWGWLALLARHVGAGQRLIAQSDDLTTEEAA